MKSNVYKLFKHKKTLLLFWKLWCVCVCVLCLHMLFRKVIPELRRLDFRLRITLGFNLLVLDILFLFHPQSREVRRVGRPGPRRSDPLLPQQQTPPALHTLHGRGK